MKLAGCKVTIAKTFFKSKNYLEIEGMLEFDDRGHPKDIVFFKIFEDMDFDNREKQYAMQLTATDLRDLCEACRELIACKCGNIDYKKETRKSEQSPLKALSLGGVNKSDLWRYYVNMEMGKKKASVSFDKYQFRTFVKKVEFLAGKLEESLYASQKMNSLAMLKQRAQYHTEGGN